MQLLSYNLTFYCMFIVEVTVGGGELVDIHIV